MRIAVVGTGISGLSAAYLLHQHHDLTVYERNGYAGGHTHTVDVPGPDGPMPVDTGFIVYNERNYPRLTALLSELGVATRASDMSFAASLDNGRVEYAGDGPGTLFAQRTNLGSPSHWRMLADIVRFNRDARRLLGDPLAEEQTLGEMLDGGRYSRAFRERYLVPMGAAIWSCTPETMLDFPASAFVRFFDNHGLLRLRDRPQWRTVVGGGRAYVERLTAGFRERVALGRAAARVERDPQGVTVIDSNGDRARFDQVVLATHADQARALLAEPDAWERSVLDAFRYQHNHAVLHSDPTLMPRRRRVWASWNYLASSGPQASGELAVTYWLNRLQGLPPDRDYFLTLNPPREPAPSATLARFDYEHPILDRRAMRAQAVLPRLQGRQRTWFCGSYFGYGFHEDGLRAGMAVAEGLGVAAVRGAEASSPVAVAESVSAAPSRQAEEVADAGHALPR